MPVQPQLIPIAFGGGLNTKSDRKSLQVGQLLELENGQFVKQGLLSKRFGYDILSRLVDTGGSIGAAKAISSFRDELLLFDGLNVYSFVEATGTWINRGTAVSVIATDRQILRTNNTQQLNPDVASHDGIDVYAWEDSTGGVRYSVLDHATGAIAINNALVSGAGLKPKTVVFADNIYIFYTDNVNNIFYRRINPRNPSVIEPEQVPIVDAHATPGYDIVVTDSYLFLGYLTGSITIQLGRFGTSMAAPSMVTAEVTAGNAYSGGPSSLNVALSADGNVWVSWGSGAEVRTSAFTQGLAPVLASTLVETIATQTLAAGPSGSSDIALVYETSTATRLKLRAVTASGSVGSATELRSVGLASKVFVEGSKLYVNAAHASVLQDTYFTVQLSAGFPIVAKIASGVGGGLRTNNMLSEVTSGLWANGIKGKILSEANVVFSLIGVNGTQFDFDNSNKFLSCTQSNNLLFVGGVLSSYDGAAVTEHGFHLFPEDVIVSASGADGGLSTGTYQYAATYEWTDNFGQIQRSAPSVAVSVSATATNHGSVTVPTLRLTAKSNVSIVIYRTTANGVDDFRRVTSAVAPLANNKTVDSVTFTDLASDTDIEGNELLYTTGGILNNIAPPAHKLISPYQSRVFLGGLEDPNLLWFSKNRFDNSNSNTIPAEFAAELTVGVDPRGGNITGLGLLDDKLVIFKERAIFILTGDGPNDTGLGSVFPDPTLVTSDAGCSNPNSIVTTPLGLMFKSEKGIYLLDRSQTVTYLGAPVEDFNHLTITSATLNADANQIIFTTSDGPALVYDYFFQQWSTWTNHNSEDSDTFDGAFTFVKSDGSVYKQNKTSFTDGGVPIFLSWTTPNMQFAGVNGYQRVFNAWILGEYKGPHKLDVSVAYDFSPAYTQFATIDSTTDVPTWGSDPTWGAGSPWGGEYAIFAFRLDFATQRCTAVRLKVKDSQVSDYNEGYNISALTMRAGAMPGGVRLPVGQIAGVQ